MNSLTMNTLSWSRAPPIRAGRRGPASSSGRAWLRGHGLPEGLRYWIYVGGFNPHKNLERLVEAFAALPSRGGGDGEATRRRLGGTWGGDSSDSIAL